MAAAKGFDGIERKAKLGGNPLIAQTLALEGNDFLMVDSGHGEAPFRGALHSSEYNHSKGTILTSGDGSVFQYGSLFGIIKQYTPDEGEMRL